MILRARLRQATIGTTDAAGTMECGTAEPGLAPTNATLRVSLRGSVPQ